MQMRLKCHEEVKYEVKQILDVDINLYSKSNVL